MAPHPKKTTLKKHNLDKKYKPWRKGKSANATSGASLKNQLRAKKRLLSKLVKDEKDGKKSSTREALEVKIKELEQQIHDKNKIDKERSNAMKYHKHKFFDKKKLTRMEKKIKQQMQKAVSTKNEQLEKQTKEELERIHQDLKYITFFPNDQKYLSIFSEGSIRVVDDPKTSRKRNAIRNRIEKEHGFKFTVYSQPSQFQMNSEDSNEKSVESKINKAKKSPKGLEKNNSSHKNKISQELNDNTNLDTDKDKMTTKKDSRFNTEMLLSSNIVKHADMIEKTLDEKSDSESGLDSDSESSSDTSVSKDNEDGKDSDSSSSSSSSSDSDSDSDSVSKSDINITSDKSKNEKTTPAKNTKELSTKVDDSDDSDDDFFVTEENENVGEIFDKAKPASSENVGARGDKSKGWATQRQLPGEFKKRRRRN